MKRLSHRNIKYMWKFAIVHPDFTNGQQSAAHLLWGTTCYILTGLKMNSGGISTCKKPWRIICVKEPEPY